MLFLWMFSCFAVVSASLYLTFNFTWVVTNQAGNIASSFSIVSATTPWPSLEVDLCRLALGAQDWGTADILASLEGDRAPELSDRATDPGCSNTVRRAILALETGGIYVCPGPHRDSSVAGDCGDEADFYCRQWNCMSTGDTRWEPKSRGDYITVKREYPNTRVTTPGRQPLNTKCPATSDLRGWCNPLIIAFTEAGKKITPEQWERGFQWGLRLYKSNRDPGLTFKIRLLRRLKSVNPAQNSKKIVAGSVTSLVPLPPRPVFQPTLPAGPPSTANLITSVQAIYETSPTSHTPGTEDRLLNLVKGAYLTLNYSDPSKTQEC